MRKQLFIALLILVCTIILATIIISSKAPPERIVVEKEDVLVDVVKVYKKDLTINIATQGTVEPKFETNLSVEVSGRVSRVSEKFVVGSLVKKGQFLLKISDSDYQLQIEQAKASIITAQSALAQEKALARVAQQEFEWRERKNLSAEARDSALRKLQIRAAQANVESAKIAIRNAQKQIERTTIRAPYDGIVRRKQVEEGQFVSPGAPFGTIFSVESVNISLRTPLEKLQHIDLPSLDRKGVNTSVKIYLDGNENTNVWQANIVRSEGVVDPRTHFVNLIAEVKDPYGLKHSGQAPLRIGTFVNGEIKGKVLSNIIEIPNSYIKSGKYVWIVNANSELEKREVSIMYSEKEYSYVNSGLVNGENVCKTLVTGYLPGTKVVINHTEEQEK